MIQIYMPIIQGLKANQINVVLVIQRVVGKVPGQTAVEKLLRTRQQYWAGNSHPQDSLKGEKGAEGNTLHKLFHVLTNTMNQEHEDLLTKSGFGLQIHCCYFWGISSILCLAARTLGSSIIFVLLSLSIIQRLIVFYALEKFANTSELNCLAACRFHVI